MSTELLRGLLGLLAFPFLAWLMSRNKKIVMWKTVVFGLLIQLALAVLVMLTPPGQAFFKSMNDVIIALLGFSNEGAGFLFGDLINKDFAGAQFAFSVLPTIIFFSSLMSIIYYTGVMQKIVEFIAWLMMKMLGTSGAETLSVSSNMFVGQTEAPLVVKPFIGDMTRSELSTIMTGGFATVAGGVMAAYVGMLSDSFPGIAGHLLTASIMSAPAAIVMSKLAFPEIGSPKTGGDVQIEIESEEANIIDAAAQGAQTGLKLAGNVGAMLLAFISLVALANQIVGWGGNQIHQLVTSLNGASAFIWGLIFGGLVSFLYIARLSWQTYETKFWIGGVLTTVLFTSGTYALLGGGLSKLLTLTGIFYLGLGILISFLVMVLFTRFGIEDDFLLSEFLISFILLCSGSIFFGLIAYLVGGTASSLGASISSAMVLALIPSFFVFWNDPERNKIQSCILYIVSWGLLSFCIHISNIYIESFQLLNLLETLTLELLFGYLFSGIAFLMGVPIGDVVHFGELIGHKIVVNEFVAFQQLQMMAESEILDPRSLVIASYALCGFANFSSIAIQIGGIGGLAPDRQSELAEIGVRTMICGALASFQTAAVAGVMQLLASNLGIDLVNLGGL